MGIFKIFISVSAMFVCLKSSVAIAAQWARVAAPKAVVYADPQMSSPIGYFKEGQKIRVGEVPKNKGKVLPTLLNRKVVYIKVSDLETSKDLSVIRSASERLRDQEIREAKNDSRIGVSFNLFLASALDFKSVEEEQDFDPNAAGMIMGGAGIFGQIRKSGAESALKMKVDYLSGSIDDTHLSLLLLTGEYSKDIFSTERLIVGAFGGISLSPWSQYEVTSLFSVNGYGVGASGGLEGSYRIGPRLAFHLECKYQYLKLMGFSLPESTSSKTIEEDFSPSLAGPAFAATLSYSF